LNNTRLILVEGIPGSGKTSTAQYIKQLFDIFETPSQLYLEGSLDHPADYESVACLDEEEFRHLKASYPECIEVINQFTGSLRCLRNYKMIYYGKLQQELPSEKNNHLFRELSKHDVYNLPIEMYEQLIIERWIEFSRQVQMNEEIIILECCFLQNPLTVMFGRFNQTELIVTEFIKRIERIIQPLNPRLIYFHQDDIKKTLNRVIKERPKEWLEHIIWYFTEQGYGKSKGYQGFDGLCEVLKERKRYELDIINLLYLDKLVINNTENDWEHVLKEIRNFLQVVQ
jgi:uridine kinase